MPVSDVFGCAPNNRLDSQIDILIDRLCTERNRMRAYNSQQIKKCVASYTTFNLIHRITEFVKSFFGSSDWQLARRNIYSSLMVSNLNIFSDEQAKATADKILGSLAKSNEQNVFVSSILSYDIALRIMSDELINTAPDRFELGQYEFNVVRAPVVLSNPRLLFN